MFVVEDRHAHDGCMGCASRWIIRTRQELRPREQGSNNYDNVYTNLGPFTWIEDGNGMNGGMELHDTRPRAEVLQYGCTWRMELADDVNKNVM